jgi:DNA-binding CsgD family transcriptional regulator
VEIVGRESELEAVLGFVDRAAAGPAALVLRGEPGVGKTVLWRTALEHARETGLTVLATRPTEAEASLSFIALHDLFEPVLDTVTAGLPPPQRRAIEIALRRADPDEGGADEAAVALGILNSIRQLAGAHGVLIGVDDEGWLDAASATVLASAIRRLADDMDVRLLITRRLDASPSPLAEAIPEQRRATVDLGPLTIGALHRLVRLRLGIVLARPAIVRLHGATRGNPLYALELVGGLGSAVADPDAFDVGVPADLHDLLGRRLATLSDSSRRTILAAALASRPTPALLAAALDLSVAQVSADIDAAIAAGIVVRTGARIEFSHPLLASAARAAAPPGDRRSISDALARLVDDPEERAVHLARATDGPDEAIAAALEDAARSAVEHGAVGVAVDLQQRAVDRTPTIDPTAMARRVVQLADLLFTAGDTGRAHQVVADVLPGLTVPEVRAQAALLLATIVWFDGDSRDAATIAEAALAATADVGWRARLHSRLGWIYEHDVERSTEHARQALALVDPERDPALYAFALLNAAVGDLYLGRAADHEAVARGQALQERARLWDYSTLPANWAKWMDDFDRARELTELYLARARANGDESSVAQLLTYLGELEAWTGALDHGLALIEEAVATAEQTEQPAYLAAALARRAAILASRGDLDRARSDATEALGTAERTHSTSLEALARGTLAAIALLADDPAEVDRECTRASAALVAIGDVTQPAFRFHADHIEAVVALGDLDRAGALVDRLEARGKLGPCRWALATAARGRALIGAGRGDLGAALDAIETAIARHEGLSMPIELGRTWLVAGQLQRRAGRRRAAAESLDRARAIFDGVGARAWSERARREHDRLGLQAGDGQSLTPSEERVARLAASGLTNRAVAGRLSISPKTVEANLARIYSKLGIHSRAELGSAITRLDGGSPPPTT